MTLPIQPGTLFGVGVGPGDPELLTLRAVRALAGSHVVAYPVARHGRSNARTIAAAHLTAQHLEHPMVYPVTTEISSHPGGYEADLAAFYDRHAELLAQHLTAGRNVAILCEGDPFFYGSYMYFHDRLAPRFPTVVIPGVPAIMGASAALGTPIVRRDSPFTTLPGTLPTATLVERLQQTGPFAIMKLGRNFLKVRQALEQTGLAHRALYIERATMPAQHIVRLADVDPANVPYFSLILVPDETQPQREAIAHSPGWLSVVGLGPGAEEWLTPEASATLAASSDLIGYHTYLARVPPRSGQRRFGSDNKVELDRASHALTLAAEGHRVSIVSSGDPGIFAMASAVLEAIENGPEEWRNVDLRILPGLSAMQAAASRVGAPLGHDFCVVSLSDRLKPWDVVANRLRAAAEADFALALYNPISSERQWQLAEARKILLQYRAATTPVILARAVGRPDERIQITTLELFNPAEADMQTVLLIGSSTTRTLDMSSGRRLVYTLRTYADQPPS